MKFTFRTNDCKMFRREVVFNINFTDEFQNILRNQDSRMKVIKLKTDEFWKSSYETIEEIIQKNWD